MVEFVSLHRLPSFFPFSFAVLCCQLWLGDIKDGRTLSYASVAGTSFCKILFSQICLILHLLLDNHNWFCVVRAFVDVVIELSPFSLQFQMVVERYVLNLITLVVVFCFALKSSSGMRVENRPDSEELLKQLYLLIQVEVYKFCYSAVYYLVHIMQILFI